MWRFLKIHRGQKFTVKDKTLLHSIDKTSVEQNTSRRVSRANRILLEFLVVVGELSSLDGKKERANYMVARDWDTGTVRYKKSGEVYRIFEMDKSTGMLKVGQGAAMSGLTMRFAEQLPSINFWGILNGREGHWG